MSKDSFMVNPSRRRGAALTVLLCLFPFMALSAVFIVQPFVRTAIVSVWQGYDLLDDREFVFSLSNYRQLMKDEWFRQGILNTLRYTLWAVPGMLAVGMAVSLAMNAMKGRIMRRLVLVALFLPMITSGSAIGYSWRYMFHERIGLINYLLSIPGVKAIRWLSDIRVTMTTLLIFGIWRGTPLTTLLLYTGLSEIDPHLIEAAEIDGASKGQAVLHIIIPLWSGTILAACVINAIGSLKLFDELFYLFQGKPGPYYNMNTIIYYIYENMRMPRSVNLASAASMVLVTPVILLGLLRRRNSRR